MKSAIRGLAIVLLSGVIGLLLSEGLVRLIMPQQLIVYRTDLFVPADSLHHVHAANLNTTMNTGERSVRYRTDADGWRIGEKPSTAPTKLLILGDSFMEAAQVEYEQSLAGLLEARVPAQIRNTGTVAFAPSQYAIVARRLLGRESFDYIVVGICLENDEEKFHAVLPPGIPHLEHPIHWPDSTNRAGLIDAFAYPINDALEEHSHLFILARHTFQVALMKAHLSPLPLPIWYQKSLATAPAWDTTSAILDDVGAAADAHKTPIVFVLFPSSYQVDTADFNRYVRGMGVDRSTIDLDQPNRILTEHLRRSGRIVVDPTKAMRAAVNRGVRTHERFDPHLSREGHAILADLVLAALKQPTPPATTASSTSPRK